MRRRCDYIGNAIHTLLNCEDSDKIVRRTNVSESSHFDIIIPFSNGEDAVKTVHRTNLSESSHFYII